MFVSIIFILATKFFKWSIMAGKFKVLIVWILCLGSLALQAQQNFNCFTIVAGKKATADGSVLLAHNEDDYAEGMEIFFNVYQVPAQKADVAVSNKGKKTQNAEGNLAYLWIEMPGMHFSDSYMNEYGVVIVSDACPSREDKPRLTDGGITWELRNTMARQATSARHAVEIARKLILEKGYNSSGRTYCIADPQEAWMLSVVNGKHFVALRIPDTAVAIIPNYYTITTFDTADHENVITSPGLIDYAIQRGWYNPKTDGPFNFRKAYGSKESLGHMVNIGRMWAGVNLLAPRGYDLKEDFPWAFTPREPISVVNLMDVLRNHYEGTALEPLLGEKLSNPHEADPGSICAQYTRYGMVAHLQSGLPRDLGNVIWLSPMRPCSHAYVPFMVGMKEMPAGIAAKDYSFALQNHLKAPKEPRNEFPKLDYWKFEKHALSLDKHYREHGVESRKMATEQSQITFNMFIEFQQQALALYKENPDQARNLLEKFCLDSWQGLLEELNKQQPEREEATGNAPEILAPSDPRKVTLPVK